ncbi:hypothetical protein [Taibaiella koreensis]|uniref:hypothetical protein n=1 Tax=Taibaiella koreensis TaxID=1268548 RepID=UPI000E59DF1C|nr:hypothetical protein [Taibaiella koreensis]
MMIKKLEFRYNILNRLTSNAHTATYMKVTFEAMVIAVLADKLAFVIDNGGHCSVHVDRSGNRFTGNIIGSPAVRDKFREEGFSNKFDLNF